MRYNGIHEARLFIFNIQKPKLQFYHHLKGFAFSVSFVRKPIYIYRVYSVGGPLIAWETPIIYSSFYKYNLKFEEKRREEKEKRRKKK